MIAVVEVVLQWCEVMFYVCGASIAVVEVMWSACVFLVVVWVVVLFVVYRC